MVSLKRSHNTPQRILKAATQVFAREGLAGATTRKIAQLARVNEVTLFRHFKSKDELLRQAVLKSCESYENVFEQGTLNSPEDLRHTVGVYVAAHVRELKEHADFVRMFYGEAIRRPALSRQLLVDSHAPVRQHFIRFLLAAKRKGLVRKDLDATTSADALTGMLVAGILRRPFTDPQYSYSRYCRKCEELFLRGITP